MKNNKTNFAGFWIRNIAITIDFTILFVFWILTWIVLNFIWVQIDNWTTAWIIISLLFDLFWFLYFAWFHHHFWQTPWKMAVWVKVVRSDNLWKISRLQAIWRSFATILSALPLFLWYAWAWWDSKKRTFHDLLAQTVVIEDKVISKWLVIFWNIFISWLLVLMIFLMAIAFYYVIQHPEVLMQMW